MPEPTQGPEHLTWDDVLALVAQLDDSGLADAEIDTASVHVRVSRNALPAGTRASEPAPTTPDPGPEPAPPAASLAPQGAPGAAISAPMLGVLYFRPSPDEAPFVSVGDAVDPDTTVAILEVMKLMNPVTAGLSGTIAEVCGTEGAMVEFGDVLFRLAAPA